MPGHLFVLKKSDVFPEVFGRVLQQSFKAEDLLDCSLFGRGSRVEGTYICRPLYIIAKTGVSNMHREGSDCGEISGLG